MRKNLESLQKKYQKKYPDKTINFHFALNNYVSRGNGYSGFLGLKKIYQEMIDDRIVLSMGDHLYSYRLIDRLCNQEPIDSDIIIATDPDLNNSYLDIAGATKIMGDKNGFVVDIGKEINKFNRIDMGVFILKTEILSLINEIEKEQEIFGWTDVVRRALTDGLSVNYFDTLEQEWIDIDNYYDYKIATGLIDTITQNYTSEYEFME